MVLAPNVCVIGHLFGIVIDGRGLFNKSTADLVFTMYLHCSCILFRSPMYCICIVHVVPLSCACIVHACTRHTHTHTPAFALQTHSVWMPCKVSLACEWQRKFKAYRSRSSCDCLHHQTSACRPSRSTSHLQGARPRVPPAHSELETTH